eukprot:augustus_masked-scaffold_2-processed-gene-0.15-mRNA-1 protein AED:0.03 eAED:0.05 QI:0/-1/0/1/-1/1/1/0/659
MFQADCPVSSSVTMPRSNFQIFQDVLSDENEAGVLQDVRLNPVEHMNFSLSKAVGKTVVDPTARPDIKQKALIQAALDRFMNHQVSSNHTADINLLWTFQHYLINLPKALIPFFNVIDWEDEKEEIQGQKLLMEWNSTTIHDALVLLNYISELLGVKGVVATSKKVHVIKEYSISILNRSTEEELSLFLIQIFQFFRYDKDHRISEIIFDRAMYSVELCSNLLWMFEVEVSFEKGTEKGTGSYSFLREMFLNKLHENPEGKKQLLAWDYQASITRKILSLSAEIALSNEKAKQRNSILREMVSEKGKARELLRFDQPMHLPLYPKLLAVGIDPTTARVIPSNTYPVVLDLMLAKKLRGGVEKPAQDGKLGKKAKDSTYVKRIMFKSGDDIRQDQLVLQLFAVGDYLLKQVDMDMHLTIYKALPLSQEDGAIEFVNNSFAMTKVAAMYGNSIRLFLRKYNPFPLKKSSEIITEFNLDAGLVREAREDQIHPHALHKFIKSCAAYCVLTYILGVGDRHLDNLMLKSSGELLHIDFGYILGRDPKSFHTDIRLTKEMVITMGGRESLGYRLFTEYCCQVFLIFRKNSDLFLNLISLMRDARIPDLSINQDYNLVLSRTRQKFLLDKSEAEAQEMLIRKIDQSADALAPVIYDLLHSMATAIK